MTSRGRRSPFLSGLAFIVAAGAGVGLGWLAFTMTAAGSGSSPAAASAPTPASPPPSSSALPSPPEPPPDRSCPRSGTEDRCLASLFPSGTFGDGHDPALTFVCQEDKPVRGGGAIRSAVVRGADAEVTEAMRTWAVLGWYELPAFAAMRARCCPSPPPLTLPPYPAACAEIGPALERLARVAADPTADEDARERASDDYAAAILCLTKARATKAFGQPGAPDGGARTAFRALMKQIAQAEACDASLP